MKKQRSNALWQLLVLVALAAAVALTLAWPQLPFARREGEPVEVSVILRGTDGSDWANARLGMEQAAGELRAEVRIVTLSVENDAAEQARLMGYEAQRGRTCWWSSRRASCPPSPARRSSRWNPPAGWPPSARTTRPWAGRWPPRPWWTCRRGRCFW